MRDWFGYRWFVLRHRWACFQRDLPWTIALWLPPNVALMAFVRVYSCLGECGPEYSRVYHEWERRHATKAGV